MSTESIKNIFPEFLKRRCFFNLVVTPCQTFSRYLSFHTCSFFQIQVFVVL